MRVFVTGADGFVGVHLIRNLLDHGHNVIAGVLSSSANFIMPVPTVRFNLLDCDRLDRVIEEVKPEGIIHLAAQSMVKLAWDNPAQTIAVNIIGTINLVNAVAKHARNAKIINVGSSEEYGLSGKLGKPLTEEDYCLPQNPYATSKLAAGQIVLQLANKEKLRIIHVRPFNHFGPQQREGFVVSDFASQIAKIEKGLCPPIMYVGDLSAKRDFTDVRDIVEAYTLLLEKDVDVGIYNICSGIPHTAREILNIMLRECRSNIDIRINRDKMQPSSVPIFIGSAAKLHRATGWAPKGIFDNSIKSTLSWWLNQDFVAVATQT